MLLKPQRSRLASGLVLTALLSALATPAMAQHEQHTAGEDTTVRRPGVFSSRNAQARVGLMAIGLVTRVSPIFGGATFTEGYLTQPNLMLDGQWRALRFDGALNFEGITIERGELTPGIYGEGYVDRRHPHTFLHEAMLSLGTRGMRHNELSAAAGVVPETTTGVRVDASISVGKGFAPFGTDDPMMRPLAKYPVNHHHAQILERAQVVGALRVSQGERNITVETGVFNGDEPTSAWSSPTLTNVGNSRAARLTLRPASELELQVSGAYVESPDFAAGGASNHNQRSASARWSGSFRELPIYFMTEWARTDEEEHDRHAFRFTSFLAEAATSWRDFSMAARFERTDRPDKERLLDPFRTPVGHIDFQIQGISRWSTATLQLGAPAVTLPGNLWNSRFVPFVEVARAVPVAVLVPTVFEPEAFYGARVLWSYSVGLRMHLGSMRTRMGRYGVGAAPRDIRKSATPAHH